MTENQTMKDGLVIAAHGQRGILETPEGDELAYLIKGKRLRVVCGDRVMWARDAQNKTVTVNRICNRNNALTRFSANRSDAEVITANLTCLIVVFAPVPKPDWFLIDRYLCAGAHDDHAYSAWPGNSLVDRAKLGHVTLRRLERHRRILRHRSGRRIRCPPGCP